MKMIYCSAAAAAMLVFPVLLSSCLSVCAEDVEEHIAPHLHAAVVGDGLAVSADVAGLASDFAVCHVAESMYRPVVSRCDRDLCVECDIQDGVVFAVSFYADNLIRAYLSAAV